MVLLRRSQTCGIMKRMRPQIIALAVSMVLSTASFANPASPKVEAFWLSCQSKLATLPEDGFYRIRHFSNDAAVAKLLVDLIRRGEKTVTFTTPWIYADNRNATPVVGGYTLVTDFAGTPELILRTTGVKTMRFDEISERESQFEGPGARPLDAWQRIHWNFFSQVLEPIGKAPADEMPVTVEYFEVVCGDINDTNQPPESDNKGVAPGGKVSTMIYLKFQ